VCEELGEPPNDAAQMIGAFDNQRSGRIDFEQFVALLSNVDDD
jgi:Ca2+-binding EF-hand superfamily protein